MKRLWGIRHIRWLVQAYRLSRWVEFCQKTGLGIAASPADVQYLEDVKAGMA